MRFKNLSKAQNGTFFHYTFRASPIQNSSSAQFKYDKQQTLPNCPSFFRSEIKDFWLYGVQ